MRSRSLVFLLAIAGVAVLMFASLVNAQAPPIIDRDGDALAGI